MAIIEDAETKLGGGLHMPVVAKTAAYTATTSDYLVTCDATSGAFTVTLPAVADAYDGAHGTGLTLVIKKTDSGVNAITVDGSGAETIDGATTVSLAAQYDTCVLQAGSAEWHLLATGV